MSGGVDSNAIISIAKRVFDYDVHGFTIVNTDERYAEQDMVDQTVKELGIRHTNVPVRTDNFLEQLHELIHYHDAPVYTISYYAHWLLMEAIAEEGYRISVSGTAADELFTGYYDHYNMYLYEVRNDEGIFPGALSDWNHYIKPIVRNPFLQDPLVFVSNEEQRDHIYLDAERFSSFLKHDFHEEFKEVSYEGGLLRKRMQNELFHEAVPVILHEDDLNAMYFSIENRSPFLDRSLFDFCYSIPTKHLIREGYNKKILRDAMRGIVPDPIIENRRKVGFNAPIFSFLDIRDDKVRQYILDDGPIFEHVRKDRIEGLLHKDFLPNSESKFLFYFICTKMFLEAFSSRAGDNARTSEMH
jgi:asparagine synthase (glutamine-hydrolysing)